MGVLTMREEIKGEYIRQFQSLGRVDGRSHSHPGGFFVWSDNPWFQSLGRVDGRSHVIVPYYEGARTIVSIPRAG